MQTQQACSSLWRLRYELVAARLLIWRADPRGRKPLKPGVHFHLADRYGRLARSHSEAGRARRAAHLDE